ncbi:hypothetical protein MASR2M48_33480 [Spirochaetota bacterium]
MILRDSPAYKQIKDVFPCRILDTVAVKGKTKGVAIYTAKRALSPKETSAWANHAEAMALYQARSFRQAAIMFKTVTDELGADDYASVSMAQRCDLYAIEPPSADWGGVEVLKEK